jgi:hypothetical protein
MKHNVKCFVDSHFCSQEFVSILIEKILNEIEQQQTHQPEKWMADLAISSIHLKEGNTFSRYNFLKSYYYYYFGNFSG